MPLRGASHSGPSLALAISWRDSNEISRRVSRVRISIGLYWRLIADSS